MPLQCNFTIAANSRGGKCTGGFVGNSALGSNDYIAVTVTYTGLGQNQPAPAMEATFVVSAAPGVQGQQAPSPFTQANDTTSPYLCAWSSSPTSTSTQPGKAIYQFQTPNYPGSAQGSYELTAVFTVGGIQYSEDPEFDTGV
jgi:hypothetical protein